MIQRKNFSLKIFLKSFHFSTLTRQPPSSQLCRRPLISNSLHASPLLHDFPPSHCNFMISDLLFIFLFSLVAITHGPAVKVYAPRSLMTYYEEFVSLMKWGRDSCEHLLASQHIDALFDLGRDRKFDVLITEYFDSDCSLGLAYKLNITLFVGMVCKRFLSHVAFLKTGENFSFSLATISLAVR